LLATQILIPERWLVQPAVVSMQALQEPTRKLRLSLIAERAALSAFAALRFCDKPMMVDLSMNPPSDMGMRILRHILVSGDRRYWSWTATKKEARGKVRSSLMWELRTSSGNISTSLGPLLEDGVLEITKRANGNETVAFTPLGKMLFAELQWRWFLLEADPEFLQPLADSYGWQEISIQVDKRISFNGADPTRKVEVIAAIREIPLVTELLTSTPQRSQRRSHLYEVEKVPLRGRGVISTS